MFTAEKAKKKINDEDKFNQRFNERENDENWQAGGIYRFFFEGGGSNIYHSEVAFPRGVAATVTERARPLQGVAAALAAVQGDVLLTPRHSAPTQRTRFTIISRYVDAIMLITEAWHRKTRDIATRFARARTSANRKIIGRTVSFRGNKVVRFNNSISSCGLRKISSVDTAINSEIIQFVRSTSTGEVTELWRGPCETAD